MSSHVPLQRRRREGVTDYRARRKAISSESPLLVVRVTNKNISAQFVRPSVMGDSVVASVHSAQLRKMGWKGSLKSTPASYLLGLLAGKRALEKGVTNAVLYNGLAPFVSGGRISAFAKGVADAGVGVPISEDVFPSEDRLSGKVIAEYAKGLAAENSELYSRLFSGLSSKGFKAEDYESEFRKLKSSISGVKS